MAEEGGSDAIQDKKILDFGCGYGGFLGFLLEHLIIPRQYTGVEIVPEFIEYASNKYAINKYPFEFMRQHEVSNDRTFDHVFINGVFPLRRGSDEESRLTWQNTVRWCLERSPAVSFDFFSVASDFRNPDRYYEHPGIVWDFLKSIDAHGLVNIRNNYLMSDAHKCPFSFTVTFKSS
jgi:SAM-dependent methyltransferase